MDIAGLKKDDAVLKNQWAISVAAQDSIMESDYNINCAVLANISIPNPSLRKSSTNTGFIADFTCGLWKKLFVS